VKKFLSCVVIFFAQLLFSGVDEHLQIAIKDGNYDLAEYFLDKGADPNAIYIRNPDLLKLPALTFTYYHARRDRLKIMELLIKKGAKTNATLEAAVNAGDPAAAHFLLTKGADINCVKKLIGSVVEAGYYDTAKWLLLHGADANFTNEIKGRPLMHAIFSAFVVIYDSGEKETVIKYKPKFEMLELLIKYGADPTLRVFQDKDIYYYLDIIGDIPEADKQKIIRMLQPR